MSNWKQCNGSRHSLSAHTTYKITLYGVIWWWCHTTTDSEVAENHGQWILRTRTVDPRLLQSWIVKRKSPPRMVFL